MIHLTSVQHDKPPCIFGEERGFTLVEMALVALLLGIMATIMFGVLNGFKRTGDSVEDSRICERTARFVMTKLTREISSATSIPLFNNTKNKNNAQSSMFSALGGGMSVFEGKNDVKSNSDSDTLRFVASNGGQPVFGALQNAGPVEVTYYLAAPENKDDQEFVNGRETFSLIREEYPVTAEEKVREMRHIVYPLASRILGLNFRYLYDEKWSDEWLGNQSRTLPRAVEISLVIAQGTTGGARLFKTAVSITQRIGTR